MRRFQRASPLLLSMFLSLSCGIGDSVDLRKVFDGFELIVVEPLTTLVPTTAAPKGNNPPNLYKVGSRYVFRSSHPVGLPEIATDVLPLRLRTAGATLVMFPRSENDMSATSFGTPAWEIRFSQGSHEGRIFNRFNRNLAEQRRAWPSGSHDDYVLEIAK